MQIHISYAPLGAVRAVGVVRTSRKDARADALKCAFPHILAQPANRLPDAPERTPSLMSEHVSTTTDVYSLLVVAADSRGTDGIGGRVLHRLADYLVDIEGESAPVQGVNVNP